MGRVWGGGLGIAPRFLAHGLWQGVELFQRDAHGHRRSCRVDVPVVRIDLHHDRFRSHPCHQPQFYLGQVTTDQLEPWGGDEDFLVLFSPGSTIWEVLSVWVC